MTNRDQPLRNSTAAPANRRHNEHRAIADAWLRQAIGGIQHMHLNESARRKVAEKLF